MALTSGTRLGVYDITVQIGEGGMGQVWRATDTSLGRQVAISPDGQRFLMIKNSAAGQAPTMVVVLNWHEESKAKLPAQ